MKKEVKEKKTILTNDENISNLNKRKKLRIAIIISSLLTIIAAIASYFIDYLLLIAVILFIITTILTKAREKTIINKSKELLKIERELEKHKLSKKRK